MILMLDLFFGTQKGLEPPDPPCKYATVKNISIDIE